MTTDFIDAKGRVIVVTFRYDAAKVAAIKQIARESCARKAFNPETKAWRLPLAAVDALEAAPEFADALRSPAFKRLVLASMDRKKQEAELSAVIESHGIDGTLKDGRTLYAHQLEDAKRMLKNRFTIVANEMGTGKTITALVVAKAIHEAVRSQTLVIAPAGLCQMWRDEGRAVGVPLAAHSWAKVPEADEVDGVRFVLILEEAHYAQSTTSQRCQRALALADKALAVFPLTGTPMKNGKPGNLFPLLKAIRHPLGRNKTYFETRYCGGRLVMMNTRSKGAIQFWKADGAENLEELRKLVGPQVIRRLKRDCLDLPKKTRVFREVDLSDESILKYKRIVDDCKADFKMKADAKLILPESEALVMLSAMRRAASLAKVEATVELIEEIIYKGQAVVFTAFVDTAKRIAHQFGVTAYIGETPVEDRPEIVKVFQSGIQKVFVGTTETGGLGLTLTAASTVILVDRPMTPGDVDQAESRVDRIGQHWPVTSLWLRAFPVCRVLDRLLLQKMSVVEKVIDGLADRAKVKAITAAAVVSETMEQEQE